MDPCEASVRNSEAQDKRNLPKLWERYEASVHELVVALDPSSEVRRDQRIRGRLSQSLRQIDVWAEGCVAGVEITVAVECKRYKRTVTIGEVDQFIGMLLDIGADRGVLYSYSGFSSSAVMRAQAAWNPHVITVALETPKIVTGQSSVPGYPADLAVQDAMPLSLF